MKSLEAATSTLDNTQHDNNADSSAGATNKQMCIICYGKPFDTVFLPCRHMYLCHDCAEALFEKGEECPACRTKVENTIFVSNPPLLQHYSSTLYFSGLSVLDSIELQSDVLSLA